MKEGKAQGFFTPNAVGTMGAGDLFNVSFSRGVTFCDFNYFSN